MAWVTTTEKEKICTFFRREVASQADGGSIADSIKVVSAWPI